MGRKTVDVIIEDEGRDKDKVFVLTEMSASHGEKWANRFLLATANAGSVTEYMQGTGFAGLAMFGWRAVFGIKDQAALELLDEMFECVRIKTKSGHVRDLIEDDIEEVKTRWFLRAEVFSLHTGFSRAEIRSMLISAVTAVGYATTPTSPEPSESSFQTDEPVSQS